MAGPEENTELCFPKISMFPEKKWIYNELIRESPQEQDRRRGK